MKEGRDSGGGLAAADLKCDLLYKNTSLALLLSACERLGVSNPERIMLNEVSCLACFGVHLHPVWTMASWSEPANRVAVCMYRLLH